MPDKIILEGRCNCCGASITAANRAAQFQTPTEVLLVCALCEPRFVRDVVLPATDLAYGDTLRRWLPRLDRHEYRPVLDDRGHAHHIDFDNPFFPGGDD